MLSEFAIDILCLTETWHEDISDVPIRRLRANGFQVIERARPRKSSTVSESVNFTNHGGIAIVASTRVKVTKLSPNFEPSTFELLCARISSCGASCIAAALYRPGSENVNELFFDEFAKLLEYLLSFSSPFFITCDINVHFERTDDAVTVRMCDLLASYGASQHVYQPTHDLGGVLDVIITADDTQPTSVAVDDPGLSDHRLVHWQSGLRLSTEPVYVERECRLWRNFDLEQLISQCIAVVMFV